jgi:hypothetical protein
MPSLSILVPFEQLHLAIPLSLPLLPITLAAFQLSLCLLHHRKGITARYPLPLSFYATGVFIPPYILTLNLGEYKFSRRLLAIMAVPFVTRRGIPGLVHPIAVPSGVAKAHTLLLLLLFVTLLSP